MKDLKEKLFRLCVAYAQKRANEAKQAINDSQEAAIEETKSSAGDKYETGREMMQQETDMNMQQLNAANKLLVTLNQVDYKNVSDVANPGSVVNTNNGKFYIAISAGALQVDSETFFAVSPASPIGQKLMGKKTGDEFDLNGKNYRVESVN